MRYGALWGRCIYQYQFQIVVLLLMEGELLTPSFFLSFSVTLRIRVTLNISNNKHNESFSVQRY